MAVADKEVIIDWVDLALREPSTTEGFQLVDQKARFELKDPELKPYVMDMYHYYLGLIEPEFDAGKLNNKVLVLEQRLWPYTHKKGSISEAAYVKEGLHLVGGLRLPSLTYYQGSSWDDEAMAVVFHLHPNVEFAQRASGLPFFSDTDDDQHPLSRGILTRELLAEVGQDFRLNKKVHITDYLPWLACLGLLGAGVTKFLF